MKQPRKPTAKEKASGKSTKGDRRDSSALKNVNKKCPYPEFQTLKFGKPSTYKPEYCTLIVEFMAKGYSYISFRGQYNIPLSTFNNWLHKHEEFAMAYDRAKEVNRMFWEWHGIRGATEETFNDFNSAAWKTNMENRFKWGDRTYTESKHDVKVDVKEIKNMSREELKDALEAELKTD